MTDDAKAAAGATQSDVDAGTRDSRDVGQRTGNGNGAATDENGAARRRTAPRRGGSDRARHGVREQIARGLRARKQNRMNAPEQAVVRRRSKRA